MTANGHKQTGKGKKIELIELDNELTLVVRDHRSTKWYWIDNIVQDDYRPLIGGVGMDLYNLYSRRAMNDSQKTLLPRKVILPHLSIAPSTLTEVNYVLEWCELIYIKRAHHRVHGVYLLDPKPIRGNAAQLEQIKQNIIEGTGGLRPRKAKYPSLRATMLERIETWRSLTERIEELDDPKSTTAITIIRASELQATLPGLESPNGEYSEAEFNHLVQQVVSIFANGDNNKESVRQEAENLLADYGADVMIRQLERWPRRCKIAEESERGLESAFGLFIWSVKKDAPEWIEKERKDQEGKSWYSDEEFKELIRH